MTDSLLFDDCEYLRGSHTATELFLKKITGEKLLESIILREKT